MFFLQKTERNIWIVSLKTPIFAASLKDNGRVA